MKLKRMILTIAVALLSFGLLTACGQSQEEQIRRQLGALDNTSLSEIVDWLDNEFPEFEDIELFTWSMTDEGDFLREGILDDEDRFLYFEFLLTEESLMIDLIYETLDFATMIQEELDALDTRSFRDIVDWIEHAEDAFDDTVRVNARSIDLDGDWLYSELLDYEEQFEEWEFDIDDQFTFSITVNIYLVYNSVKTFGLGDTFVRDGLEITFGEDIVWGIITDEWSRNFGEEFFKVPVTTENISNSTINSFFPRQYGPDGTSLDSIWISGVDDDITMMGGLRPGASHSGYVYFAYAGDGDYIAEFWDRPFDIEVIIPISSADLRPADLDDQLASDSGLQEIVDQVQSDMLDLEAELDGLMEVDVQARGDNEIVVSYTILEPVSALEIVLLEEIMDEYLTEMEEDMSFIMRFALIELGLDSLILTHTFYDLDGDELFSRSITF